ncbi:UNKNOWN [Stylonychia lemnae]|uniref:Choline ethanolamine kinase n=1 Tax=Stylonychia lemnae TaxID=5949 RepID=A0A078AT48_STYLE|nr:UNKNOWN [Stylonychia lemnae]|eukprot:CDW84048.1 UNKNOWN [Stylonychia lemnae]
MDYQYLAFKDFPFDQLHKYVKDWDNVSSIDDVEISLPGGFTGTTFVGRNKSLELGENNPIIIKLYDTEKRPGLDKEKHFAQILIEKYYEISQLKIFEMRNPHYMQEIVKKLVEFEYNPKLNEFLFNYNNGKKQTLLMGFRDKYYPQFKARLEGLMTQRHEEAHLLKLNFIKENFYDIDMQLYLDNLLKQQEEAQEDILVSHYDVQQGNILSFDKDTAKIMVIDYEDPAFAPNYNDLGSFLGCFMKDNNHPGEFGIKFYPENMITEREIRFCAEKYLSYYHETNYKGDQDLKTYIEEKLESYYENVVCSMIFMNVFYGIWAIIRLRDEIKGTFLAMGESRVMQNQYLMKQEFIRKVVDKRLAQYQE